MKNYIDICEISKENDSEDFYYDRFGLPSIIASDAHNINEIGTKFVWIKADPTFEGLKQIRYEPKERVKIQETNPALGFEKSPFTKIIIEEKVDVFEEEPDNVAFAADTIPLNSGLVSIIGGRGTGKSILIDYISTGLGQKSDHGNFTKSDKVTIERQTSLKDRALSFIISEYPSIPFMYISQSQIKDIVVDTEKFTQNIRQTIGVTEEYSISFDYKEKAERYINEYFGTIKILEADKTDALTKKSNLDKEIKKYNDFVASITSEGNKQKLERYKSDLDMLEGLKSLKDNLIKQRENIVNFENTINLELNKYNERITQLNLVIPLIKAVATTDYIANNVLPIIDKCSYEVQSNIDETKNAFSDYAGDLATLLDNVTAYQKKIIELQDRKRILEETEKKYSNIKQTYFLELGHEIEQSIMEYSRRIESQWEKFTTGRVEYTTEMKQLLADILGENDNLTVSVDIAFNRDKMYDSLLEKLDKRSFSKERLENIINISTLADYIDFIKQTEGKSNVFNDEIRPELRG